MYFFCILSLLHHFLVTHRYQCFRFFFFIFTFFPKTSRGKWTKNTLLINYLHGICTCSKEARVRQHIFLSLFQLQLTGLAPFHWFQLVFVCVLTQMQQGTVTKTEPWISLFHFHFLFPIHPLRSHTHSWRQERKLRQDRYANGREQSGFSNKRTKVFNCIRVCKWA